MTKIEITNFRKLRVCSGLAMNSQLAPLITEFEFEMPKGLLDKHGAIHRRGMMRLATARDELIVQKDRRSKTSPGYAELILLSRVITRLGNIDQLIPEQLENLFSQDFSYLNDFYSRINQKDNLKLEAHCPECKCSFDFRLDLVGESGAIP
jgi:hypothetical protein